MSSQVQQINFSGARPTIIGIVVISLGLLLTGSATRGYAPADPTWRFACPDESMGVKIRLSTFPNGDTTKDSITEVGLSGPITDIPEYHDCQRFIDSNGRYDSTYAIFAAFRLDAQTFGGGTPVATIYTPDGTYDALGIAPGFNCLVMSHVAAVWTATVVNKGQGHEASNCTNVRGTGGKRLEVKEQPIISKSKLLPNDFPPVARWDWDSVYKQQYIGIRCGPAWCEVGAPGFVPSAGYTGPLLSFDPVSGISFSLEAVERVQRIKGWYDAQRLAMTNVTPQRPSEVHGFLIPSPALELINLQPNPTSFYRRHWIQVGYAVLESGDYRKWNFSVGNNKIYFCYGTNPHGCEMPPMTRPEHFGSRRLDNCLADPNDPAMRWWAKTVSAKGIASYACVKRTDHGKQLSEISTLLGSGVQFAIVGTARWKFLLDDEGTWHGCPTGCCTKE